MNTYELSIRAMCPSDNLPDWYEMRVESNRLILVEDVLAAVKDLGAIYQEDLTRQIARRLGAKVTTVGYHYGVKVTSCAN